MSVQTSYTQDTTAALEGQCYDASMVRDLLSRLVEESGGVDPGLLLVKGTADDQAKLPPTPAAADVDAIMTTTATTTGVQTFTGAGLDGAVGASEMSPYARKIDLILNSHADWDATTAVLEGLDENGLEVSENLAIPDAGNATVTSTKFFSKVTKLTIPAQSGTSGSFTLGTNAGIAFNAGDVVGVSALETARESKTFADKEVVGTMRKGRIWVKMEDAHTYGAKVFARHTAAGAEKRGAFRTDADTADAIVVPGARLRSTGGAGDLAILEVDL